MDSYDDYDDIEISDGIDDIHQHIDSLKNIKISDVGDNYVSDSEYIGMNSPGTYTMDDNDEIDQPERFEVSHEKWLKNPDIPRKQLSRFDKNRSFFGSHVANSNTRRTDNIHHMMNMEAAEMWDRIPTRRHRANFIRQQTLSELQLCRSNPEEGGFERKMDRSVLKREDVDVKQLQTLSDGVKTRKSSILGFFSGKNRKAR